MAAVYDVVIIGAGAAGLTLAYQLLQADRPIRIALVHDGDFPNDGVTYKVGEAINEVAAIYFSQYLGLNSFMKAHHPLKMAMRFFQLDGSSYKEMGLNGFPPNDSFHFERGKLENNLFDLIKDRVSFYGNHKYVDFTESDGRKRVSVLSRGDGVSRELDTDWVIDAAGLKKIFARKFGINRRLPLNHSSSWIRFGGGVNVDEFLPRGEDSPFTTEKRSWSAIHLEGRGYWIWILRLSEDITSVGLIINEDIYDFREIETREKLMLWLKEHVRQFYDYLEEKQFPVVDFRIMRRFASMAEYWVSQDKWAIVGDAYGLWDPYYSNGFDLIAIQNTALTALIGAERKGEEINQRINDANKLLDYIMQGMANIFDDFYHRKDRWYYVCVKYSIDLMLNVSAFCPLMHNSVQVMFQNADAGYRNKVFDFLSEAGWLHQKMISFLKTDAFRENGFEGDKYFLLKPESYHAFNPDHPVEPHDMKALLSLFRRNIIILKCALYYLESGRDFLSFIKGGAYFSVTEETDPEHYRDDPDRLERDLFRKPKAGVTQD